MRTKTNQKGWPRAARAFGWLLALVVVLEIAYVLLANLYLNSFSLHNLVNRSPQHFYMDWRGARTWFPGSVRLEGVSLSGRGSQDLWYCGIRECSFLVSLPQLLRHRVVCPKLDASGVDFRLRHDGLSGEEDPRVGHPPIPKLLAVATVTASPPSKSSWSVGIEEVALRDVRQIWIAGLRVAGAGEIHGSVDLVTGGKFEARLDAWRLPQGELGISGRTISTNLGVNLSGKLGPLVFSESRGEKIFNHLDAILDLNGDVIDMGRLTGRVDPSSSVSFGGAGALTALIQVIHGVYWPGSSLVIQSPAMRVTAGDYSWRGKARLVDRIELDDQQRPCARLELEETELELWYRDKKVEGAKGPRLSLRSVAHDLRLISRFADADLSLHLSPMRLPDVSQLGAHLPHPLSKVFESGNILVAMQFDRTAEQGITGTLDITGEALEARLASKTYRVDARLEGRFRSAPNSKGHLNLSQSSLLLTNVSTPRLSPKESSPWSARIALAEADLNLNGPWSLQASVAMGMHDTRPILAALRSLPDTPGWLRWIPTIRNLAGQFDVDASRERLGLNQLSFVGRGTEIRAELDILDAEVLGLLYVRYGIISLGLELSKSDREWHLLGAKRWYDARSKNANR